MRPIRNYVTGVADAMGDLFSAFPEEPWYVRWPFIVFATVWVVGWVVAIPAVTIWYIVDAFSN